MTVSFEVHGDIRRGPTAQLNGQDGKLKFRNTLVYRVKQTGGNINEATAYDALLAPGLPKVNLSPYRIGNQWIAYSLCTSKSAKQTENAGYWDVTCQFESPSFEGNESDNAPENLPASVAGLGSQIEYSSETIEQVVWETTATPSEPILNPLGEYFAEPTMAPVTLTVATYSFYADTFPWTNISDHGSKVNDDEFNGKPRYSWLITDVERSPAEVPLSNGTTSDAFRLTYTVKYNPLPHGWKDSKLLTATKFLNSASDALADAEEFRHSKTANRTTGFVNLDGTKSTTPVYQDFEHIETLDFDTVFV